MRHIAYRGPGTGLRLEGVDGSALDVGGSHAKGAPMTLFVQSKPEGGDLISMEPAEVALLMEQCGSYLARHHGVKDER